MSSTLWQKAQYRSKIEYAINNIREFDISKANISVLRDANVLSEDQYQYFLVCPRMERQIFIGKLQGSNPEVTEILKSGIANAKKVFMESNGIQDSEILYIRNDAIAIIGNRFVGQLDITDRVHFRQSAVYSSFYKVNAIDMLYYYNPVNNVENLDVKGLSDESIALHKEFMLDFLCELFCRAQMEGAQSSLEILQGLYKQYISRDLPVGFYRELNSQSYYKLDSSMAMYSSLFMDNVTEYHKKLLDISYNESILRLFSRIYASICFK